MLNITLGEGIGKQFLISLIGDYLTIEFEIALYFSWDLLIYQVNIQQNRV